MKEIVLSVKRQKTEIKIFCVCIALAYLMNIISIIAYGTSWSELWTQSLWMLLITCGFYGLSVVLTQRECYISDLFSFADLFRRPHSRSGFS